MRGRPKKRRSVSRPGPRERVVNTINELGLPPTHLNDEVLDYILPPNTPFTRSDVECSLCRQVLVSPVQLPCGAHCCTSCVCEWVQHTPTLDPLSCPCCSPSHTLHTSQIIAASTVLLKLLESLLVRCKRCGKKVAGAAEKHLQHLESSCELLVVDGEPTSPSTSSTSTTPSTQSPDNIISILQEAGLEEVIL